MLDLAKIRRNLRNIDIYGLRSGKNILIVGATALELMPLCREFGLDLGNENKVKYETANGCLQFLVAGIGPTFFTYNLTRELSQMKYDIVINAGIAGSFDDELRVGTVVNVIEEQFTDLGIEDEERFLTLFEHKLLAEDDFPFKAGILINQTKIESEILMRLPKVLGTTASTVHGSELSIKKLKEKYCLDIETMEGGAFFYVMLNEKLPFAQVRAISNYVAPRSKNQWNAAPALKNLSEAVAGIIKEIWSL